MTAFTLEIRKYQNSRLSYVVLGLAGFLSLWLAILVIIGAARAVPGPQTTLTMALYNFIGLITLLMGPAVAILAGRVAGVDQEERMGQFYRALGQSPLQQFLIKLTLLTILAGFVNFSMLLVGITVGGACRPRGRSFIRRVLLACRRPDAGSYTRGQCSPVGFG